MVDFMGMMKRAQELQAKMGTLQEELGRMVVEGNAGAGLVRVSLNGKGEMQGISIDPSLFKEDSVEVLEDLIVTAHRDAKSKADAEAQRRLGDLSGGADLLGGLKL
jgi:DNA-binding YbaB/EbfC family protein